ncbi:MAG: glycosyltransferase family 2 protein [Anaerolineae bacterium]|nr:glycosyltransferase family 2 protein [Gloeobacterales cyanobacterium ES-bin-313]
MTELITPLILTFNEAPNLRRTLEKLYWAKRIIIIDSYSTDQTLEIANSYPVVQVFQRHFDTHGSQWNYGLHMVITPWVLSLDADYVLSDELIEELQNLKPNSNIDAFSIRFRYCVFGSPLPGSLLPPRVALFRRDCATYINDGHTQLLQVSGKSNMLDGFINHDDRKPLGRWLQSQARYMALEVEKLNSIPDSSLSLADRLRKTRILAPLIVLLYCLFIRGCLFAGWAGWYYTLQRVLAEILLSLYLIEHQQMRIAKNAEQLREPLS